MKLNDLISVYKLIAPKKTTIPMLKSMAVKDGVAWVTDMDVYASWPTDSPDGVYRLVGPQFEAYPKSAGKNVDDMPPLPPVEGAAVGAEIPFPRDELKQVLNFTVKDPARPLWGAVCFRVRPDRTMEIIATDRFALCRRVVGAPAGLPEGEYIVPAKAIRAILLDKYAPVLSLTPTQPHGAYLVMRTPSLTVVTRLIDAKYYSVDAVMPRRLGAVYRLDLEEFREAVKTLGPYINPEDRAIRIRNNRNEDSWTLRAKNAGENLEKSLTISSFEEPGGAVTAKNITLVVPMSPPENETTADLFIQHQYLKQVADSIIGTTLYVGVSGEFGATNPVVFSDEPLCGGDPL